MHACLCQDYEKQEKLIKQMKEKGKSGKQVGEAMQKRQREAGARSRKGDRSGEAEESSGPRMTDLVC